MIKDWAWIVVFNDDTKIMARGVLERQKSTITFKPQDRNGERTRCLFIPYTSIKILHEANPKEIEWPEDELFFNLVEEGE